MGYINPTIELAFPELGDGIKVIITNPKLLPWGKKRELFAGVQDSAVGPEKLTDIAAALVRAWTVPDLETGETLPAPSQDNTVMDRCPSVIVERIIEECAKASGVDPNSGNS